MKQEGEEPLQAHWPEAIRLWAERMSDYYQLPFFFQPAFPSLEQASLHTLARLTRMYASSILLQDELVDGDLQGLAAGQATLRVMAMQFEAYHLLHPLIPAERSFWGRFRRFLAEYAEATLEERRFASGQRPWSEYTEELAHRLILGKNGISRVAVVALVELAGDERLCEPLLQSLNQFNLATQLCDDLSDWKEDLRQGIPSLLLRRMVSEPPKELDEARLKALSRELFYGGHAAYAMRMALDALQGAARLSELTPPLPWFKIIEAMRRKCQGILDDVSRVVEQNVQRARRQPHVTLQLPPERGPWQRMAGQGVSCLLGKWQQGFGEARDLMQYPQVLGLSVGEACVQGDVFQRAIFLDVLCDATALLGEQLRPVLDHEAAYLVDSRIREGFGGWRYFTDLPDLPPDTDDLAQIMQALLRSGHRAEAEAHCEGALQVLLRDGTLPDGSLETWIVPAKERSPLQQLHAELVQRVWGAGSDADVMANLLYALQLYAPRRFAEVIQRGQAYLEREQRKDGTWASRWYAGPYYGVHVGVRHLAVTLPGSPALRRVREMLRATQASDGGWGLERQGSDSLSTALALLALATLYRLEPSAEDAGRALRAREFLEAQRSAEGDWPSKELIHVGMRIFHGSRTVTTAFVLKAALAWQALQES